MFSIAELGYKLSSVSNRRELILYLYISRPIWLKVVHELCSVLEGGSIRLALFPNSKSNVVLRRRRGYGDDFLIMLLAITLRKKEGPWKVLDRCL